MYRKLVITFPFYLMLMNDCFGAEPAVLQVRGIVPHEVVQRVGFEPNVANGYADVAIHCEIPAELSIPNSATWQYRVVGLADNAAKLNLWNRLRPNVDSQMEQTVGAGVARIAAGGWYRLEIQCKDETSILARASVEPIGVGEVFLVAGQSYCTNCNDERLVVMDPAQRVVAMTTPAGPWTVANDPQPVHDGSDGGSIWPPVGDALAEALGVPIAFANVGIGGSHSAQWLPGGAFHQNLVATGKKLGRFRAVLWQQGESDVISKTTTDQYVANIQLIEKAASDSWIQRPIWLLAKSTHHPTVYDDPAGESAIRQADDLLCTAFPFQAGPDTDTLRDENRGGIKSRQHFTAIGQRRAASLWVEALKPLIAAQLQNTFGSEVSLKNRAVGGWSVANGVEDLDNLLAEKPNLVVVAYGMNDVGARNPQWYHDQTETILRRIQSADPTTEVLLVSPMLGHGEWVHPPREMFGQYGDQLMVLVGPGVALADLTQVWTTMLEHKHDFDLTGNGLNHPNDFGHRLYAQTLLSLFNLEHR